MNCALGVDIGGTKIQFCRIDDDLNVTSLGKTPTALLRRGTTAFADDLAALIRSMMPIGGNHVAVSLNGILNEGEVIYSSLMGGRVGFDLQTFLSKQLGHPVNVDDDIHAMAVAEATLGKGNKGVPFALLNLGTGIGVGCHTGTVLRGKFAAGLISEQKIYVEELGEFRSLDRTVCGRGIKEIYKQLTGNEVDAVTVFERARSGLDDYAGRTVAIFTRYLGEVMQMISRFYHPGRIVINGSIKKASSDYMAPALATYLNGLEPSFRAEICISELEHAAELGTLLARGSWGREPN